MLIVKTGFLSAYSRKPQEPMVEFDQAESRLLGSFWSMIRHQQEYVHDGCETNEAFCSDGCAGPGLVCDRMRQFGDTHVQAQYRGVEADAGYLAEREVVRGTISSFTGDRVESRPANGRLAYLSLEAGGDEARGLQPGGAVEIMVNDRDEIVAYQRPADEPPTKSLPRRAGETVQPSKGTGDDSTRYGRDVGFYARRVAMEKLAALEVGETADFAVDRAYLLVDVFSLGQAP